MHSIQIYENYNIYCNYKVDAQNFVANLMTEEESVGKVTAVPSYNRLRRHQEREEENEDDTDHENIINQRKAAYASGYNSDSNDDMAEERFDENDYDENLDSDLLLPERRGGDEVALKDVKKQSFHSKNVKKRKVQQETVKISSKPKSKVHRS